VSRKLRLGLDIGPTSIGWALVEADDERSKGQVVAAGVRVFPEGVDRDQQGGEQSKNQTRRTARGARRRIKRRATRKQALYRRLVSAGLLPANSDEFQGVMELDPYELRAQAVGGRLKPYEIGRALVHIAQRRGFQSNRKDTRSGTDKGILADMESLEQRIKGSGCQTLGEYLYRLGSSAGGSPPDSSDEHGPDVPLRGRHTRRDMYTREFETIWAAQRVHHPEIMTDELKRDLYDPSPDGKWICKGLIFGQRRMYWPREVVGRCELEPKCKRCLIGERPAQRFRLLSEVNNLRCIDRQTGEELLLTPDQRSDLIEYLSQTESRTFDQIRKKLGFHEQVRFNLEGPDRSKLKGHITDAKITKSVKDKAWRTRWAGLDEATKDRIVRIALEEDQEEEAIPKLIDQGLSPDEARGVLAVHLPDARSSLSREAIAKLLPHLETGKFYMGKDATDSALHAARYLRPDEQTVRLRQFLPPSPDLPNPIVRGAMVEVRRVVNAILREICDAPEDRGGLGGRRPDAIHVELAREAKKSLEQRRQMRIDNASRNRSREQARTEIEKYGKATPGMIRKYSLWQEQRKMCLYTGRMIGIEDLLSDATDVDHILPRWRSLDDSMMNKVLCYRDENAAKGQQTAREWLEHDDPAKWEQVLQRAEKLPYPKLKRVLTRDIVLDDFVQRQFQDTAYITRAVTQYLRCLGVNIVTPRGGMTAELRRSWGLNNILSDSGEKTRADHRHHAIDAAVAALTTPKRLFALANERGRNVTPPWPSVRDDLSQAILMVNVSHKPIRRIRGALHDDKFSGATNKPHHRTSANSGRARGHARDWVERPDTFVKRRPVADIKNPTALHSIRDRGIKLILMRHLESLGIDTSENGKQFPADCFKGKNAPRMPSDVPIRRVRTLDTSSVYRRVSEARSYQFVRPDNNHHVTYRKKMNGAKETWTAQAVATWDVAERARRRGLPLVDSRDSREGAFVMSLSIGEAFLIQAKDGSQELNVVQKITNAASGVQLFFKSHTDARSSKDRKPTQLSANQLMKGQAQKVVVDAIGRIRRAGD
jgi:CRISPR-associated endonuclease Csn1